jgi:(2Fe-2S) ferredoxin
MPHRETYFFVCVNRRADDDARGSCAQKGSEALQKRLKELLKEKGLASRFRACTASCLDMCETGITMVVEPEHVAYGKVRMEDLEEIVEAAEHGHVVEHLLVGGEKK